MKKKDSLKDMFSLRERINKLFEDMQTMSGDAQSPAWAPAVDVYETAEGFVVKAELPGVKESEIDIRVEGNVLRIRGERRLNMEGRSYHQMERFYGAFSRCFVLPSDIEQSDVKAKMNDGILRISLPKKYKDLPRQIEIK